MGGNRNIYLQHVLYEIEEYIIPTVIDKVNYSQRLSNMYCECIAMHARNLVYFFKRHDSQKRDIEANLYNYSSITKKEDYEDIDDLNKRVSHLGKSRTELFPWDKCIEKINKNLLREIAHFLIYILEYCSKEIYISTKKEDIDQMHSYIDRIKRLNEELKSYKIGLRIVDKNQQIGGR